MAMTTCCMNNHHPLYTTTELLLIHFKIQYKTHLRYEFVVNYNYCYYDDYHINEMSGVMEFI